jgi:tetratricopeptide (TPR) repeat protein/DNA-binding CsgD family transcriptional regulator
MYGVEKWKRGIQKLIGTIISYLLFLLFSTTSIAQPTISEAQWSSLVTLTQAKPDSAYALYKAYLLQARKEGNRPTEANCLLHMGEIHLHFGQYNLAFENLLQAEAIFRSNAQFTGLSKTLNELGNVYYYNQQRDKALACFREAYNLNEQWRNAAGMALASGNIGKMYEKRMRYDSALFYQQQALQLALQAGDKGILARTYEHLGSIMEDNARYDSAWIFYTQAHNLFEACFNEVALAEVINNLADVLRKTGKVRQSMELTRKALQKAEETNDKYQQNSAMRDLSKCYNLLGLNDSAYLYLERSRDLMQAIYTSETSRQTAVLQSYYDSENKNTEIERLQTQKRLGLTLTIASLAILLLVSLLTFSYFSRQKLKMQADKELALQKENIYATQKSLMEAELRNTHLLENNLKQQLEIKSNELSSQLLHLIQKNELLEEIKAGLGAIIKSDKRDQRKELKTLFNSINQSFNRDQYWDEFRGIFDQVHGSFFKRLSETGVDLSPTEMRLLSLIKMNISSQDTATLLGITTDSLRVTRYRLKKKLGLENGESLTGFVQNIH